MTGIARRIHSGNARDVTVGIAGGRNSTNARLELANRGEEKIQNIRTCQGQGSPLLNALSQQTRGFFKRSKGKWNMAPISEGPLPAEILKRQQEIKDHKDLVKIVQSIENRTTNPSRITDRGNTIRGAGTNSGREVCWRCRQSGHKKLDCKVPINKIFCAHCRTRKHNTYPGCPATRNGMEGRKFEPIKTKDDKADMVNASRM